MIHSERFDVVIFDDLKLSLLDIPNANENDILIGYNIHPIKPIEFEYSRNMAERHSMIVVVISDPSGWIYHISVSIHPDKFQIRMFA
jgi:hypothetical protein